MILVLIINGRVKMDKRSETAYLYNLYIKGGAKAAAPPRAGQSGRFYNPDTAEDWKQQVRASFICVREDESLDVPLTVEMDFYLPRPKVFRQPTNAHYRKPDIDNLLKSTLDAISEAGVWKDDARVHKVITAKYYADAAHPVGAEIKIRGSDDGISK